MNRLPLSPRWRRSWSDGGELVGKEQSGGGVRGVGEGPGVHGGAEDRRLRQTVAAGKNPRLRSDAKKSSRVRRNEKRGSGERGDPKKMQG